MRWLLEMSTLVHVLGNKTCKKFLIKFHAVYFNTLGDACIDVVVSDDLEIVGHSFPVKVTCPQSPYQSKFQKSEVCKIN